MPKRKKHPKLPSGWGSIRYLGKGRRNPYAVHPPCTEVDDAGNYVRPPALCYVSDWYVGFAVLNAYRAGTYKPGDEVQMTASMPQPGSGADEGELESLAKRILSDYTQWHAAGEEESEEDRRRKMTFAQVYEEFYEWKFGKNAPKNLSESRKGVVKAAYGNLEPLHGRVFRDLRVDDLQAVINACPLARGSLEKMKGLLVEMYKYADARELCDRDYSKHVIIPAGAKGDEHGEPFASEDLKALWNDREDPTSEMLLIMCYTGFRITAYKTVEVKTDPGGDYLQGGIKTEAGRGRVVPIHPAIRPLIQKRIGRQGCFLDVTADGFRDRMQARLKVLGIVPHTPHDCRHTFSALLERYGVSDADRKRLLGHSLGKDVTNGIYGHRTLEDLRAGVEKIPSPPDL